MNGGNSGKASRVPNPNVPIQGRIAMQHPSKGKTKWETNVRRRSASPRRSAAQEDSGGHAYGRSGCGGGSRYQKRDYDDGTHKLGGDDDEGGGGEDEVEGEGEGEGEPYEPRRGAPFGVIVTGDGYGHGKKLPYPGYPGRRTDVGHNEPIMRDAEPVQAHHGYGNGMTGARGGRQGMNGNRPARNNSRANKGKFRRASAKKLARELEMSIEYDPEDDVFGPDRDILGGQELGTKHFPISVADAESDADADNVSDSQPRQDNSTNIKAPNLEDVVMFAWEHFGVDDPDDLVVGVKGMPEVGYDSLAKVMMAYIDDRFGLTDQGLLKPLSIIDREKLNEFNELRAEVARRGDRIRLLEDALGVIGEEIEEQSKV